MIAIGPGRSTVLIKGFPKAESSQAALINGAAGTWFELEEGNRHARGHPGIHVLPPALALAEEKGVSGQELLTAFLVGYEAAARIGAATIPKPGYHPHGTWGTIGAAAAAARLMQLDVGQIRQTLNVAAALTVSAPFSAATEGATVRNLFAGVAAYNGILAARAVLAGFIGLKDGPGEIFSRLTGQHFDPAVVTEDLGQKWMVDKNYFKMHGYCRHNHTALEALLSISELNSISPQEVKRLVIYTHAPASDMGETRPASALAARFSIPYSVAATLVVKNSDESATSDQALADERIKKLLAVTEIYEEKTYTARYPKFRDARVEIFLADGRILVGHCENPPGDMDLRPYARVEIEDKFLRLSEPLLDNSNRVFLNNINRLGSCDNVTRLFSS
jgi:2-methylcitrate dehydratase PrpD